MPRKNKEKNNNKNNKLLGRRPLRRPRRLEDSISMDLRENGMWVELAQNLFQ
jgi:hypothetical protein